MRSLITTALLTTALALPLGSASAQSFPGQNFPGDLIARCTQAVGKMKFEGWPADRNREMMMLACEQNGGAVPGAQQESPVSLPRNAPQRQR